MSLPLTRMRRHRQSGFTLIEVLVAVLLLTMSMAAIVSLWRLSRTITERNRDWGEYYAVARQEVERDKALQFKGLFGGGVAPSAKITDYDEKGVPLATVATLGATATANAYYRSVSSYSLVATGTEDVSRRLGVQVVQVYRKNGATFDTTTPVFQTTDFYAAAGV